MELALRYAGRSSAEQIFTPNASSSSRRVAKLRRNKEANKFALKNKSALLLFPSQHRRRRRLLVEREPQVVLQP